MAFGEVLVKGPLGPGQEQQAMVGALLVAKALRRLIRG